MEVRNGAEEAGCRRLSKPRKSQSVPGTQRQDYHFDSIHECIPYCRIHGQHQAILGSFGCDGRRGCCGCMRLALSVPGGAFGRGPEYFPAGAVGEIMSPRPAEGQEEDYATRPRKERPTGFESERST